MKLHSVQVRRYQHDQYGIKTTHEVVEIIKVALRTEAIGNFNPVFCTYRGRRTLVHSDAGDLSDPFRVLPEYALSLFIETKP